MPEPLTASDAPRLFLLDGMALAYRAHFAFIRSPLTNSRGVLTSAVFGFLAALDRILEQENPEEIVVVFDPPGPTFRHERYPDYKATREKMPEEMIPQLDWIRQAVEALGIAFVSVDGFEADDVIGTLAVQAAAAGKDVWIVSGDKDMMQLVTDQVRLYNVMKPGQDGVALMGPAETVEKFGVPPDKVIDVLGLMGDSSDNVPGVPGVGPKRALALIEEYGTLESVLEHAPDVKQKKLSENLTTFAEQARLSRELVTIDTEVPLEGIDLDMSRGAADVEVLRMLYVELDFKGRLENLEDESSPGLGDHEYVLVDTPKKVEELARTLALTRRVGGFCFDTETTGLDPHRDDLVGISFAWFPGVAWYVPLNLDPPMYGGEVGTKAAEGSLFPEPEESPDVTAVLAVLRRPLEDPEIPKCGQNMKFDIHMLGQARYGVEVRGVFFDTMVASYVIDPGSRIHNLDGLALSRLSVKKTPTSDLIGSGKNEITMRDVPVERVADYACEDADVTLRLRDRFLPELEEKQVMRVFREAEMPLIPVLVQMEQNGIRLDVDLLRKIGKDFELRIDRIEAKIHEIAGEVFNIRSTATLGRILFEDLELHKAAGRKRPKKTSKGQGFATDEQTLKDLEPFHELPRLVLEYRHLTKLKSTYVDTLPEYVHPDGRIRTSFHQMGAATGRLSSSDPNLQNIPIRSAEGRAIREAFVPEDGWVFLSCDYSQIELRLLAHLSGDPGLLDAFQAGEDIHRSTAARIFGVALDDVTPELRGRAKAVNFGVLYGMGPQRLARETKVTMDDARGFIDSYFKTYAGVRAFLDKTIEDARETGYVMTLLGRRRYLPELTGADPRTRAQAQNVAVNTPCQGTAADLIKLAMIHIHERLREDGYRARMLIQIHDELLFECPEGELDRLLAMVTREMQEALPLDVPIVVDSGVGKNWSEAH